MSISGILFKTCLGQWLSIVVTFHSKILKITQIQIYNVYWSPELKMSLQHWSALAVLEITASGTDKKNSLMKTKESW